jgi:D-arabinose 1-dehydrogenase-like Zn-dependent alcohol dehydrogenase
MTIGPSGKNGVHGGGRFRCVLFATDFNAVSKVAAPYAVSLARENQARLVLLHVLPAPKPGKRCMSPIPSFDYDLLYYERVVRSVANNTRQDGEEFLRIAAEIPIETRIQTFSLQEANRGLNALKNDAIPGAAVLEIAP